MLRSKLLLLLVLATGIFASSNAGAVLLTTSCGPLISNIVRTENAPSVINAVAFVNLPGAVTGIRRARRPNPLHQGPLHRRGGLPGASRDQ